MQLAVTLPLNTGRRPASSSIAAAVWLEAGYSSAASLRLFESGSFAATFRGGRPQPHLLRQTSFSIDLGEAVTLAVIATARASGGPRCSARRPAVCACPPGGAWRLSKRPPPTPNAQLDLPVLTQPILPCRSRPHFTDAICAPTPACPAVLIHFGRCLQRLVERQIDRYLNQLASGHRNVATCWWTWRDMSVKAWWAQRLATKRFTARSTVS